MNDENGSRHGRKVTRSAEPSKMGEFERMNREAGRAASLYFHEHAPLSDSRHSREHRNGRASDHALASIRSWVVRALTMSTCAMLRPAASSLALIATLHQTRGAAPVRLVGCMRRLAAPGTS